MAKLKHDNKSEKYNLILHFHYCLVFVWFFNFWGKPKQQTALK